LIVSRLEKLISKYSRFLPATASPFERISCGYRYKMSVSMFLLTLLNLMLNLMLNQCLILSSLLGSHYRYLRFAALTNLLTTFLVKNFGLSGTL
jgi:hypothetical protein